MLASSLDFQSSLSRLTRLLVPQFADYCIVQLQGVPPDEVAIAQVEPERLPVVRQIVRGFDPLHGPPTHAQVFDTGEPVMVESPPPGFPEGYEVAAPTIAALRQLNPSSWIVVPLRFRAEHRAPISLTRCGSRHPYGRTDLLVFTHLARIAASAIENARLYEMSRAEREGVLKKLVRAAAAQALTQLSPESPMSTLAEVSSADARDQKRNELALDQLSTRAISTSRRD